MHRRAHVAADGIENCVDRLLLIPARTARKRWIGNDFSVGARSAENATLNRTERNFTQTMYARHLDSSPLLGIEVHNITTLEVTLWRRRDQH